MGRTRAFDIEQAMGIATQLFWQGYEKTSMTDLTGAMGIGAASFYFAFESKEALFRTIVERYVTELRAAFETAFQAPTTRLGVRALLRGYVEVVTAAGHAPGCLVVNNSPIVEADDELRQWLAEHRQALRQNLENRFVTDLAEGKLPQNVEPKTIARFVATLAGGIAVEASSGASRHELYDMIEVALNSFDDGCSSTLTT